MKASLHHLPYPKRIEVNALKDIVVSIAHPEKIILFGVYSEDYYSIDFETLPQSVQVYDLLVIIEAEYTGSVHRLLGSLEEKCNNVAPTTVIIYDLSYVNKKLAEGSYFLYKIHQEGILLYETGRKPFVRVTPPDIIQFKTKAEKDFVRWGNHAYAFFISALFNRERGNKLLSMFLLHQAVEQMYQAILLTHTGHKTATHNVGKLRRHTIRLSRELADVFPTETLRDRNLFMLIMASYKGARYDSEFEVTSEDLELVIDRVGRLLAVGDRICRELLATLEELILCGVIK